MHRQMKSDTQFNNLRLVDGAGASDSETTTPPASDLGASLYHNKWLFIGVCAACAIGAVAAGSYAAWLIKKREADSVILDVHDLIQSCEDRVAQIEAQINRINPPSE